MIASPDAFRVRLQNGVTHFISGRLHLRRFRSDHGVTDFIVRSVKAVSALLELEMTLTGDGKQIAEPGYRPLPDDYVVHWAPGKKGLPPSVMIALEPMGLQREILPFRLTLSKLTRIAAIVRAATDKDEGPK